MAKLGVSPNQITIFRLLIFVPPSMFLFSLGDYFCALIGLIFYHLFIFFDFVDGQVAHLRSMQTSLGSWLDPLVDVVGKDSILFSLILGLYNLNPNINIWIMGFLLLFVDKLRSSTFTKIYFIYKIENKIKSSGRLIRNIVPLHCRHGIREVFPLYIFFSYGCLISLGVLFNQVFVALLLLLLMNSIQVGGALFILVKRSSTKY